MTIYGVWVTLYCSCLLIAEGSLPFITMLVYCRETKSGLSLCTYGRAKDVAETVTLESAVNANCAHAFDAQAVFFYVLLSE